MRPARLTTLIALMALFIAPLIALVQFIAYWRVDVVDDQMFAYFGWRIAHGGTVYVDVWDNKPPGIYWVNALGMWLGGDHYLGIIALCVVALILVHVAYFIICDTCFFRGTAALATVLLAFFVTHIYYTGGTNRTETFLVACELCATAFYMSGFVRQRGWKWWLTGLLCGGAFTFKQTGVAAFIGICAHLLALLLFGDISWRAYLRRQALIVAGFLSALAIAVGLLWLGGGARGIEEAIFATFTFNRAYVAHGNVQFPYNFATWYQLRQEFFPILLMPVLMAIGGVLHACAWAITPTTRPQDVEAHMTRQPSRCPKYMVLFGVWFLVAFYGALMSPHAFRHYLVPTIPPLMLLGTHLLNFLKGEYALFHAIQRSAWTTLTLVAIGYFCADAVQRQWEQVSRVYVYRFLLHERAEWERLGEVVRHITGPDDRIHCWGYFPGVYLDARRLNTCRFTTTEKVGQVEGQANFVLKELERTLRAEPPVALVISSEDYEWMYGRAINRPATEVKLGPWIDENYTRVADLSLHVPTYVYKRNDRLRPGDFWEEDQPASAPSP